MKKTAGNKYLMLVQINIEGRNILAYANEISMDARWGCFDAY